MAPGPVFRFTILRYDPDLRSSHVIVQWCTGLNSGDPEAPYEHNGKKPYVLVRTMADEVARLDATGRRRSIVCSTVLPPGLEFRSLEGSVDSP